MAGAKDPQAASEQEDQEEELQQDQEEEDDDEEDEEEEEQQQQDDDSSWDLPAWTEDSFDVDEELRVNGRLRRQDLDDLAAWAARQRSLPRMRESELVKFLHSCDYDVLAAQQCINYYFKTRASAPSLFENRDIRLPNLRAQLSVLHFVVVPRLAPDGCRIIINGLTDPDPANFVFEDHQKVLLMTIDAMVMAEPTLPGIYIIYDLHLGLMSHFWKFGFFIQRRLFSYLQSGMPVLLKGCILLHTPSFISTVMRVLRNFSDKKRLDETKMLEGDDYTELHKIVPKECLPRDYGGTLPSRKELHEINTKRLDSLRDFFAAEEKSLKNK